MVELETVLTGTYGQLLATDIKKLQSCNLNNKSPKRFANTHVFVIFKYKPAGVNYTYPNQMSILACNGRDLCTTLSLSYSGWKRITFNLNDNTYAIS